MTALRAAVRASTAAARGPLIVAAYSRNALGQTGSGHFSPVAGYHPARDLVLILDVARFKYPPHWVALPQLWGAMTAVDPATEKARGWIVLDRRPQLHLPLYFRLLAINGLAGLVSALLEQAPALLATGSAESAQSLVTGWVQAVESRLADQVTGAVRTLTIPEGLPPEHQQAVDSLLAQLRATPAFQYVRNARAPETTGRIPDDVLATLLLALPDVVMARLPAAVLDTLALIRRPADIGPALAEELAALRDQMSNLRQWSCGR